MTDTVASPKVAAAVGGDMARKLNKAEGNNMAATGLNQNHWTLRDYRQRILLKDWQQWLLNHDDKIIYHGHLIPLKAKSIGAGVYEIFKDPKEMKERGI